MKERRYDVLVIGAGSAGLAAAETVAEGGYRVAVVEREDEAGGILNQCIHNGFGLQVFKEELTGPEYAERYIRRVWARNDIDIFLDTTVMALEREGDRLTTYGYSENYGLVPLSVRAVVLAMGCRERNRGNLGTPGTRPSGIFTAGLAQRLVNIDGYVPGKRAVIVGSGDIGLIMARRMSWIGAEVPGVVEIQPYPAGLTRNIVQCLNDFGIPLHLSHVVSRIYGRDRIEGVQVCPLKDGIPDEAAAFDLDCDTLLLSVGLIPDNEISKKLGVSLNPETGGPVVDSRLMTDVDGVFACGNVLHVHDLVDYATQESERCGKHVCEFLAGKVPSRQYPVRAGSNVKYVVPNAFDPEGEHVFYLRSMVVKNRASLTVRLNGTEIKQKGLSHVQPSEMISFTLGAAELAGVSSLKDNILEVSVI